ncbi:hypothetical protein OPW02_08910 [Vibrio europaeus]|uniref:Uncharacterized protein n=1 Tax=Vibrio europaeus TaxID=300876 RepID=A0A178J9G5_9VIBR|nr:hypothetical protein [Vibrio europaeus]MDC5704680.1 hypothetical protein [Vibrio europaeus]OAM98782.1 hypothetical protein AZ468_14595 [Vibrio europaeus]
MIQIAFNLLVSKGLENMFGVTKKQWMLVAVTVVVMLAVMYALANVDALEKPRKALGLDSGLL